MKATFYGVRGSIPTPGQTTIRYGGNTTCIHVESQHNDDYILDAGSGIRELGNTLMAKRKGKVNAKLYITHNHLDHIQGFPFFTPAYVPGCSVDVFSGDKKEAAKQDTLEDKLTRTVTNKTQDTNHTKNIFAGQMDPAKGYFPINLEQMAGTISFTDLKEYEQTTNGLSVSNLYHDAHPGGMFAYKLVENNKTLVFAGDYEHDGKGKRDFGQNDKKIINWAKNADVLVIDAQYTPEEYEKKKGWGHSQIEQICELAAEAKVKKLVITHHDPMHNDDMLDQMQERTKKYMTETLKQNISVVYAKEGITLDI